MRPIKKTAAIKVEMNKRVMTQSRVYVKTTKQPGFDTVLKGDHVDLTIVRYPKCLHCPERATVSCFVETAEMFLQITCEEHIPETAIIIWRKNGQ